MLQLSHSKKSNSSGSSTFNATSVDHKSSSCGSRTPLDAEDTLFKDLHASCPQSLNRSPSCDRNSLTRNASHDSYFQALNVAVSDEFEMKELYNNGGFSSINHTPTYILRESSHQETESIVTEGVTVKDNSSCKLLSPATSIALSFICENQNHSDNFNGSSTSPALNSSASVDDRLNAKSTRRLVTYSPDMSNGVGQLDGLSCYSLAETISCSDQSI